MGGFDPTFPILTMVSGSTGGVLGGIAGFLIKDLYDVLKGRRNERKQRKKVISNLISEIKTNQALLVDYAMGEVPLKDEVLQHHLLNGDLNWLDDDTRNLIVQLNGQITAYNHFLDPTINKNAEKPGKLIEAYLAQVLKVFES